MLLSFSCFLASLPPGLLLPRILPPTPRKSPVTSSSFLPRTCAEMRRRCRRHQRVLPSCLGVFFIISEVPLQAWPRRLGFADGVSRHYPTTQKSPRRRPAVRFPSRWVARTIRY